MVTFVYDGSFDGFLCAVRRALGWNGGDRRLPGGNVPEREVREPEEASVCAFAAAEADLFSRRTDVPTDPAEAAGFEEALRRIGGGAEIEVLMRCHASADPRVPSLLLHYVAETLRTGRPPGSRLTDPRILAVRKLDEKVCFEISRFLGFVRFRRAAEHLWYAPVNPDADIVGFLGPHFADRFSGQSFLIHDVKRDTAFWHAEGSCGLAALSAMPAALRERLGRDAEPEVTELWKRYFERIAIPERRNPRLQARLLPRRYRPYLTETEDRAAP